MHIGKGIVFAALWMASIASAQESVEERLAVLRTQFEELGEDIFSEREKFDKRYAEEVQKVDAKATQAANLDLLVAIRAEAEAFPGRQEITEYSDQPAVARLQKIWSEQTAKIGQRQKQKLAGLTAGYEKQLVGLRIELTKVGQLDDAVKVRDEIKALKSEDLMGVLAALKNRREFLASAGDAIPGFDFGKPGKLRGAGFMSPGGRSLDVESVAEYDDIVEIVEAEGGWQVLRSTGEMIGHARDRKDSIRKLGRGSRPWHAMIDENGEVFIAVKRTTIDPDLYGGGKIKSVASCWNNASLLLKEDGTLAMLGVSEDIAQHLAKPISELRDVIEIDASGLHFFALRSDGQLFGWRLQETLLPELGRTIDLSTVPKDIIAIDGHSEGVCALTAGGNVLWINARRETKIVEPKGGSLKNIRKIWSGGDCGVALDSDGKLHAWAPDHGGLRLANFIESLKGFKDIAVMDRRFPYREGTGTSTYVMWIE